MKNTLAELWLKYAEDDLRSAEILLKEDIWNMACFHSQQAVEKLFKAFIAFNSKEIPRTHNLIKLQAISEELAGEKFEIDDEHIAFLNDVYIDSRYPVDFGLLPSGAPGVKEAERALKIAGHIDTLIRRALDK